MSDAEFVILVAGGTGIVALLVGYLIGRFSVKGATASQARRALDEARAEHERYRQQVTDDFRETASKFRQLNKSYQELHEHLAASSERLCRDGDDTRLLLSEGPQDREPAPSVDLEATGSQSPEAAERDEASGASEAPNAEVETTLASPVRNADLTDGQRSSGRVVAD